MQDSIYRRWRCIDAQQSEPLVARRLSGEVFVLAHAAAAMNRIPKRRTSLLLKFWCAGGVAVRFTAIAGARRERKLHPPESRYSVSGPNIKKDCIPAAQMIL